MLLEGFWIRNYRMLRQFALGSSFTRNAAIVTDDFAQDYYDLKPVSLFIGRNRTGLSSVFEALDFFMDVFRFGLDEACQNRGGFESLLTWGADPGPITFGFEFRIEELDFPLAYIIGISQKQGRPYVATELLAYRTPPDEPFRQPFLYIDNGQKQVRFIKERGKTTSENSWLEQVDLRSLALARMTDPSLYPASSRVHKFFTNSQLGWVTNDFSQRRTNVTQERYRIPRRESFLQLLRSLEREYRDNFKNILKRVAASIPGVESLEYTKDRTGRPSLTITEQYMQGPRPEPYPASQAGGSLLKLLGILLLLHDPEPPSILCLEGVDYGLSNGTMRLLVRLLNELYRTSGTQVVFGTHSPGFADAFRPEDVWILDRDNRGNTVVRKVSDDPVLFQHEQEGYLIGDFWFTDFIEKMWPEISG